MKITVDINVFLDVLQRRQPHYTASAQMMSMVVAGTLAGVCPGHGLTTLYYLVRKHASKPDAEDAVVATVARALGSAFILTRTVGDFAGSPAPAITPADFLSQLTTGA